MREEFDDGAWWEFHSYLTHSAAREIKILMRKALKVESDDIELDWNKLSAPDMDDAMVVVSTTAWSYGEINHDVLGQIPEAQYATVLGRMNQVYGELPLVESGEKPSAKGFSWRSLVPASLFRRK